MQGPQQQDRLSGVVKIGVVVLVVSLGLWGCARKPVDRAGSVERIRVLESRCQKLEQDYRAVAQARDKARKELEARDVETARLQKEIAQNLAVSQERDQLKAELNNLREVARQRTAERDELKQQVAQRVAERDLLNNRVERLRKGFQQLLTQDDNPVTTSTNGPTLGSE